jgi:quercetin dioxygenase-like cupin family protein
MFVFHDQVPADSCEPGVSRKVLTYTDELMLCEITFDSGVVGKLHSHPHLQMTYVAEGTFEFTVGDETKIVKKGDSLTMLRNEAHMVKSLTAGVLIDVFTPRRDDFLSQEHSK